MSKNTTGRNEPCPCGSGKKYKHCHLGQNVEEIEEKSKRNVLAIVLLLLAVAGGVAVGFASGLETGFAVGGGLVMLVALFLVIRKPPPPNAGTGDAAGLNFGL